ncbi:MAG: DUF3090 family protein [Microthrixaceae bacterium]
MTGDEPLLPADRFIVGTDGEPGHRVFYLQIVRDDDVTSVRLEKQQVALLAEHVQRFLSSRPTLVEPDEPDGLRFVPADAWIVGDIGLGPDPDTGLLAIVLEELAFPDDDADPDAAPTGRSVTFTLTPRQQATFVVAANAAVAGGRPPCPLCGNPLSAEGHFCPRLN